jgi:hypothetical protein
MLRRDRGERLMKRRFSACYPGGMRALPPQPLNLNLNINININ